jgi:comEA protein
MPLVRFLQERFGFTSNELKVILFLAVALVAGIGIKEIRRAAGNDGPEALRFPSARSDSIYRERLARVPFSPPASSGRASLSSRPAKKIPPPRSVNINTATQSELVRLPGIGDEYARRIIAFRSEHGRFAAVDDLIRVRGIGPARLEKLRLYVTAE